MTESRRVNRGPSAGPENRQALIHAAREIFAESGYQAPLSAISRRAGVGQGSLYRHFPERIDLAVAVFDDNITDLEAIADAPDATLGDFFDAISEQAMGSTALIEMLTSDRTDERTRHLGTRVLAVVEAILQRDRAAARIGDGVEAADVMLAIEMLTLMLARNAPEDRPGIALRARAIFRSAFDYRRAQG